MRRGSGIQAIGLRLCLQLENPFHDGVTLLGNRPEHLQEGPGVHGMPLFHGKGICAVGDIGHGYDALRPHPVHGIGELLHLLFQRLGVPEGVDLVYEAGHARPFPEQAFHIRKLHMTVGVHKTGAEGAIQENGLGRGVCRHAGSKHRTVVGQLYKAVFHGLLPGKGVQVFGGKSFHRTIRSISSFKGALSGFRKVVSRRRGESVSAGAFSSSGRSTSLSGSGTSCGGFR